VKRLLLVAMLCCLPSIGTQSAVGISVRPRFDPVPDMALSERPGPVAPRSAGLRMPVELTRVPPELGMFHDPVFDYFLLFPHIPGRELSPQEREVIYLARAEGHDGFTFGIGGGSGGGSPSGEGKKPDWSTFVPLLSGGSSIGGGTGSGGGGFTGGERGGNPYIRTAGGPGPYFGSGGGFGGLPLGGGSGPRSNGSSGTTPGGGTENTPPAVPLPMAGWLLLSGVGTLAAVARRRRAAA